MGAAKLFMSVLLNGIALSVTIDPPAASGGGASGGAAGSVTATAVGGNGIYSYAWTVQLADPDHALTINSPASASTSFTFAPPAAGEYAYAVVRVTVTSGGVTAFKNLEVTFVNNSSGGGFFEPPDPPGGDLEQF